LLDDRDEFDPEYVGALGLLSFCFLARSIAFSLSSCSRSRSRARSLARSWAATSRFLCSSSIFLRSSSMRNSFWVSASLRLRACSSSFLRWMASYSSCCCFFCSSISAARLSFVPTFRSSSNYVLCFCGREGKKKVRLGDMRFHWNSIAWRVV
jgi:hypothetical protein